MKIILIVLSIITSTPAWAGNLLTPGSQFNPYVIKPTGPGQHEVTTQYPDFSRSPMAPGQPLNPYVIRRQPDGSATMQSDWPSFDNEDSGGDD